MPYSDPDAHNRRYGAAHKAERDRWRPVVAQGGCVCVRCGGPIHPSQDWDLDHLDDGSGSSPAHRACNRAAGARTRNAVHGNPLTRGRYSPGPFRSAAKWGPETVAEERQARRVAMGCPPELDGGPNDPRRDERGVLRREWGQW